MKNLLKIGTLVLLASTVFCSVGHSEEEPSLWKPKTAESVLTSEDVEVTITCDLEDDKASFLFLVKNYPGRHISEALLHGDNFKWRISESTDALGGQLVMLQLQMAQLKNKESLFVNDLSISDLSDLFAVDNLQLRIGKIEYKLPHNFGEAIYQLDSRKSWSLP